MWSQIKLLDGGEDYRFVLAFTIGGPIGPLIRKGWLKPIVKRSKSILDLTKRGMGQKEMK